MTAILGVTSLGIAPESLASTTPTVHTATAATAESNANVSTSNSSALTGSGRL